MHEYRPGQRWISQAEPELGLGTVMDVSLDRVDLLFPASGQSRQYARGHAPLTRVRFRPGDTVRTGDGGSLTVASVREERGLMVYRGDDREVPETQLSDRIGFQRPEDRLLGGRVDDLDSFRLRRSALDYVHRSRQSPARGFVGGRIDLIPHQLYIAHEVAARHAPRVLLSDEVGLGKTIEACLILHRLLVSGRVERILVLVPESLVHQWYVEMLRRFNVRLHIFDEERCRAIEAGQPGGNPFLDDQLVLGSLPWMAGSSARAAQAAEAGWDMLVVDEAHHLEWTPERSSVAYAVVQTLSRRAEGLLLLTATPEQLGLESHYARLHLLDPDRYGDFESFQREGADDRGIAEVAAKLQAGKPLTKKESIFLGARLGRTVEGLSLAEPDRAREEGAVGARTEWVDELLDLHGPGRVIFRNTRAAMSGFPKRVVHLVPLNPSSRDAAEAERLAREFAEDAGGEAVQESRGALELEGDARVDWLVHLLRKPAPRKILLICRTQEKVLAIEKALRLKVNVKAGVFHEGLTLVQRDRNAAWFAGEEDVRLLLCSEIGGEGRNFQFAQHLVLFDLPHHPELLEQRIGRLDRIGQKGDIHVHVPYVRGSPQEVLCRWYHEGLNALASSLEGGHELFRQFGHEVRQLALASPARRSRKSGASLAGLLRRTSRACAQLAKRLEQGRDRLLEMNSFRPQVAQSLVEAIRKEEQDERLEDFMLEVFEQYGVLVEEWAPHTYHLNAQGVTTEAFPSIPEKGMVATFDRARALQREDVGYLTWDHPMVTGAMDLILGSEMGNSCVAFWPGGGGPALFIETIFVLESVAERRLHADRFLAPTPIRVVVDRSLVDVTEQWSVSETERHLRKGSPYAWLEVPGGTRSMLMSMVEAARQAAQGRAALAIQAGLESMRRMLGHEIHRLESLRKINDHVRPREIELAQREHDQLEAVLGQARLRLDAIRVIVKSLCE